MSSTTSAERRTRFARAACRARSRIAWLSACSTAALVAAGCGGSDRSGIPAASAESLAAQSDRVERALADGDRCLADRLADELVGAARTATIPVAYRTPLLSAARRLAARVDCPPKATTAEEDRQQGASGEEGDGHGKKAHGKGRGKGKD